MFVNIWAVACRIQPAAEREREEISVKFQIFGQIIHCCVVCRVENVWIFSFRETRKILPPTTHNNSSCACTHEKLEWIAIFPCFTYVSDDSHNTVAYAVNPSNRLDFSTAKLLISLSLFYDCCLVRSSRNFHTEEHFVANNKLFGFFKWTNIEWREYLVNEASSSSTTRSSSSEWNMNCSDDIGIEVLSSSTHSHAMNKMR